MSDSTSSELQAQIDKFLNHFRGRCDDIAKIGDLEFRSALYLCLLDALGRALRPKGNTRERFIGVLRACSGWPYLERVSLARLGASLQANGLSTGRLAHDVRARLGPWREGLVLLPENEPPETELIDLAKDPLERTVIERNTYGELLYSLRNTLIHESRNPFYGVDFDDDDENEPLTHSYDNRRVVLIPVRFLEKLCRGCIDGLEKLVRSEGIDPYECFELGDPIYKKGGGQVRVARNWRMVWASLGPMPGTVASFSAGVFLMRATLPKRWRKRGRRMCAS